MDPFTNRALEIVANVLEELLKDATNSVIRAKLQNLNDVCRHLVVVGKQRLTVPDVVAAYAARIHAPSQCIAESSIRNKRGGANPYQKLYRAWESASNSIRSSNSLRTQKGRPGEIICQEDVAGISDDVLKHQVSLLLAQNRSYKSQIDILKQVRGAPVLQLLGSEHDSKPLALANHLALTEAEVEAVKDFTATSKLRARCLRRTENGALETTDGRRLADPGFMEALQKIVKSYTTTLC